MTDPADHRVRLDIAAGAYEIMLTSIGIVCIPSAPSESCCYLNQSDYPNHKERRSGKSYPGPGAAIDDLYANKVEWGLGMNGGDDDLFALPKKSN